MVRTAASIFLPLQSAGDPANRTNSLISLFSKLLFPETRGTALPSYAEGISMPGHWCSRVCPGCNVEYDIGQSSASPSACACWVFDSNTQASIALSNFDDCFINLRSTSVEVEGKGGNDLICGGSGSDSFAGAACAGCFLLKLLTACNFLRPALV